MRIMIMIMKPTLYQRIQIGHIMVLMINLLLMMDVKAIILKTITTQAMYQVIRMMMWMINHHV